MSRRLSHFGFSSQWGSNVSLFDLTKQKVDKSLDRYKYRPNQKNIFLEQNHGTWLSKCLSNKLQTLSESLWKKMNCADDHTFENTKLYQINFKSYSLLELR